MEKNQKHSSEQHKAEDDKLIPASPVDQPSDPDEVVHELPDREPKIPADPDDLIHTFPPERNISGTDDIDDLMHPPAIDADNVEE